jgi:hypothetical protein
MSNEIKMAGAGDCFYPEMGERHDGTALFVRQVGYKGYYLKWSPARHNEALATFKTLRIKPRHMDLSEKINGTMGWSCSVTWEAGRKLGAHSATEALL